jgi:hypothetical protein
MDFLEEYNEMQSIPQNLAVSYKFLSLFKVVLKDSEEEKRGLHWSSYSVDSKLSDEVLLAFKNYLKAKKSELRKGGEKPVSEKPAYGKILWFFYQKLLEVGAFDCETRRDILQYMELCAYIIF